MKKYIAFVKNGHNSAHQNSGVQTQMKATEWARTHVAKNSNSEAFICEIIATASRPIPVVTIAPFTPEPEPETTLTHGA